MKGGKSPSGSAVYEWGIVNKRKSSLVHIFANGSYGCSEAPLEFYYGIPVFRDRNYLSESPGASYGPVNAVGNPAPGFQ